MHTNNFASCALCPCKLFNLPTPAAASAPPKLAMNLKLLDGLVGEYALAHPNREISRVTLIEFALWYQEKIKTPK